MTETNDKRARAKRGDEKPAAAAGEPDKERIAKVMARAGLCSRRDAEAWIKAGRVAVNGTPIASPALNVGPDDRVTVDGQTIEARERTRLFLYHKPRGLVTTAKDPEGRPTVFDNLPEDLPRLVSIGRLDINTEGLLLLTNDGGLARVLELPATGWLRRYRVRANGTITPDRLEALKNGISIDGVDYAGIEAVLDRAQGANVWLTMGLREGKNREIKKVLEHLGLYVNRLIRLSFGPFQLGELAEGEVEEVRTRVLRDQLGEQLAREAGVDWDGAATAEVVTHALEGQAKAGERTRGRSRPDAGERRGTAPEPRRDRPRPSARPHVSALRAERPRAPEEPRKRISRAKTEDRKGRTIAVERITVADKRRHTGEGGTTRNARNFARERREATGEVPGPAAGARRSRRAAPDEQRQRPSGSKPQRGGFGSDRPATGRSKKDAKATASRPGRADRSAGDRGGRPPKASGPPRGPGGTPRPGGRDRPGPRGRS